MQQLRREVLKKNDAERCKTLCDAQSSDEDFCLLGTTPILGAGGRKLRLTPTPAARFPGAPWLQYPPTA